MSNPNWKYENTRRGPHYSSDPELMEQVRPADVNPVLARKAVCHYATDTTEALELLRMLGLDHGVA